MAELIDVDAFDVVVPGRREALARRAAGVHDERRVERDTSNIGAVEREVVEADRPERWDAERAVNVAAKQVSDGAEQVDVRLERATAANIDLDAAVRPVQDRALLTAPGRVDATEVVLAPVELDGATTSGVARVHCGA